MGERSSEARATKARLGARHDLVDLISRPRLKEIEALIENAPNLGSSAFSIRALPFLMELHAGFLFLKEIKRHHDAWAKLPARLWSNRGITESGCWEYTGHREGSGYGSVRILDQHWLVHRVAAVLFLDLDPDSPDFVCHHCDNPPCFNPDHLYIGNAQQNVRDMYERGRSALQRGHKNRLDDEQVLEIRRRVRAGERQVDLAVEYGVRYQTLQLLVRGQSWKHLPLDGVPRNGAVAQ